MNRLQRLKDHRGSALASVFIVVTVLIVLGMGIYALSLANTKQAKTTDTFEKDYYVADGSARQAEEALKSAALEQYRLIAADLKNGIQSSNNATSFFAALDAVGYTPPAPDSSAGGPTSDTVTITHTAVDSDTHRYAIASTATDGKTPRTIKGTIDINFTPVINNPSFSPLGAQTVIAGGTLKQNSGASSINGTVRFGSLPTYNQWQFTLNSVQNPNLAPYVDPGTAAALSWNMAYPGFTDSVRTPSGQLSLPAIANNTTVTNASFPNYTVPSPCYLEGQSNASFTISSFRYLGGQVFCYKNLSITNDVAGTSDSYVYLYCKGNLSLSNGVIQYTKIFCDGNVTINGGGGMDHVTIYCNGTISDSCTNRSNVRYYCGSYTMNGGNFIGDNIVYAASSLHLESTVSGLFYSNGSIDLGTGTGLTGGQIAAKGNITLNGSFSFAYDSAMMARLNADPFVTSAPAPGTGSLAQPTDSQIFTNASALSEQ